MKLRIICSLLMIAGVASESHSIELVYLSSDEDCASCNLSVTVGVPATFYVNGWTDFGYPITGAELRVTGVPEDWISQVTPNPAANVTLGNPLGAGASSGSIPRRPAWCR